MFWGKKHFRNIILQKLKLENSECSAAWWFLQRKEYQVGAFDGCPIRNTVLRSGFILFLEFLSFQEKFRSIICSLENITWRLKPIKGLCDTQQGGFQTNNVNEHGHLDVYRTTVYNPQSDRDNNKKDWGPGYFTLRNSQEYRQSHDPVGYKKLESFQE